jgi:hypothetical protein
MHLCWALSDQEVCSGASSSSSSSSSYSSGSIPTRASRTASRRCSSSVRPRGKNYYILEDSRVITLRESKPETRRTFAPQDTCVVDSYIYRESESKSKIRAFVYDAIKVHIFYLYSMQHAPRYIKLIGYQLCAAISRLKYLISSSIMHHIGGRVF